MTSRWLALLWGLVLGLSLAGCVSLPSAEAPGNVADGIGGTGQKLTDGIGGTGKTLAEGLGGTGKVADGLGGTGDKLADGVGGTGRKLADGIGGTGRKLADGLGGTGIIGTVTGFGSIWVNNAHVHIDKAQITANGQPVDPAAFRLGQVVAVLSDPVDDGYDARSIGIVYEVIAPIETVDRARQRLSVLGQTVLFDDETRIAGPDGEPAPAARLVPSQWVQVSGLRQANGQIVASRIDLIAPRDEVQLIGALDAGRLSGVRVRVPAALNAVTTADRLWVAGRMENGVLQVQRVAKDAIATVLERASELLLEGFLFDQALDGDIVVGGVELVLPDDFDLPADIDASEPLLIDAEVGLDGLFHADDLMALPDGLDDVIDFYPDAGDYLDPGFEDWLLEDSLEILE